MDVVFRVAWALPLVLAIGVAAMLLLRVIAAPTRRIQRDERRMSVCESLSLSDSAQVHLVHIDGKPYLIVESSRQTAIQSILPRTGEAPPAVRTLPWLRALSKARSR